MQGNIIPAKNLQFAGIAGIIVGFLADYANAHGYPLTESQSMALTGAVVWIAAHLHDWVSGGNVDKATK